MKVIKLSLVIMAAALLTIGLSGMAYAFHDGGVARCAGCHTMHNSRGGKIMTKNTLPVGTTNAYLLVGQDPSSTCLTCHHTTGTIPDGYKVSSAYAAGQGPSQMTPGGDFGWVTHNFTYASHGGTPTTVYGSRSGHSIVALDFGYSAETRIDGNKAPGGTYPVGSLSCVGCHDPHGKYRIKSDGTVSTSGAAIFESGSYGARSSDPALAVGVYRLLGGANYEPKSSPGFPFGTVNPPVAVAPETYNSGEGTTQVRVAYGSGMSEWCSNCHTAMHRDSGSPLRHPAGDGASLNSTIISNYNSYIKTGDLGGSQPTSYTSLVPYEMGTSATVADLIAATTSTAGPTGATGANVSCMTCHRAHASGWESAGRWNFRSTYITFNGGWGSDDAASAEGSVHMGRTANEAKRAYYERNPGPPYFATYQRSLCNKCHVKD